MEPSIHPQPRLVYVFDNFEGQRSLRIQAADGTLQALPLTLDKTLTLIAHLTRAAQDMVRDSEKRPV